MNVWQISSICNYNSAQSNLRNISYSHVILDAVGFILDTGDAFVNSVGTALTRETRELVGGEADQGRDSIHHENPHENPI